MRTSLLKWLPSRSYSVLRSGAVRLFGFVLSVLVLAAASLVAIPAMISASGSAAWGAIALGQVVGTIGGVAVGYGWGWFGPARIAQYLPSQRRQEFIESMVARGALAPVVSFIAALVAALISSDAPYFAAAGAVSATCMGLSASWYFVGMSRPYTMLLLDTMPRAAGTAIGILLMRAGHSALMGPAGMFLGMSAGLGLSTVWILRESKTAGAERYKHRSVGKILIANSHGIASALGSASYSAAPLAIVSLVAPGIQPAFALADRVRGLVVVATVPATTVLQGWVPRATEHARRTRADTALLSAALLAAALGLATFFVAPGLIEWLGAGAISVSWEVILLMAACVAVMFFQSVLERVVLASFELLRVAVIAISVGSVVGLPLAGLLAVYRGTGGAMAGVLAGLFTCVTIEFIAYKYATARTGKSGAGGRRAVSAFRRGDSPQVEREKRAPKHREGYPRRL